MLLFFILISLVSTLVSGTCPSGTEAGFTGLCYEPFSKPSTWYQGEKTCALNGGHLASVTSTIMNSFLAGLGDFPFNHTEFWLGGTTNFLGGSWSWSDFQNFTYQNWALGKIWIYIRWIGFPKNLNFSSFCYVFLFRST